MTISYRSWRCCSRRALARISIMVRFGESSTNSGASASSADRRAIRCQSWSLRCPERMLASGTLASADSSRIMISVLPISREKTTDGLPCLMAADRAKSKASVDLPRAGAPGDGNHLARVQSVGDLVQFAKARRDAGADAGVAHDPFELVPGGLEQALDADVVLARLRRSVTS